MCCSSVKKVREKTSDTTSMAGAACAAVWAPPRRGVIARARPPRKKGKKPSELIGDHPWKGKIPDSDKRVISPWAEDWPWEIPEGMPLAKLFGRELAPLVDVPDLDEVPLTPEELEELERLEAIVEVLEKRVEELEAKKRSEGASRDASRDESRNEPDAPAPTPTAATDADDTLAETSEEASSAPPIPATKTTRRAQPPTSPPVVALLWDVDNVNPGPDPRRAAVVAARLLRAAKALGGGALGGEPGAPADVVAFRAYANPETLARVDVRALELAGAAVVSAPSGPDQVDMTMGAHIDGFTRAWIDVAEADAAAMRFDDDGSSPDGDGDGSGLWEPFVVPRALDALLGDVSDESDRTLISNALRAAAAVRAEDAREEWLAGNAFDRFVGRRSNENDENDENDENEEEEEEEDDEEEEGGGHPNKPNACLMVVTTDNDLAPCLRRCRAAGIRVVVCGDYLPRPKRGAGAGRKTKAGRRSAAEDAGVGMTEAYWRELQTSQRDRPVGRLRLASEVDAALVWDGRRPFELEAADRDLLAEVHSAGEGRTGGRGDAPVEGNVVGVWRRNGRGVGRWPNADPVVPE